MRTEILTVSSRRMFRLAWGSVLLLAGMALLIADGLDWLNPGHF
jgi:ZIP family zinc transporter